MTPTDLLLAAVFFVIATLYSSVGHAGASGYIAAMALMSMPAAVVKPTALALNILVAGIGIERFGVRGLVPWRLVLPFVLASVPCAYFAARLQLPALSYQPLLAVVLLAAAVQLWRTAGRATRLEAPGGRGATAVGHAACGCRHRRGVGPDRHRWRDLPDPAAAVRGWAPTRMAAGASVVFVLGNSMAGLSGYRRGARSPAAALPGVAWRGGARRLLGPSSAPGMLPVEPCAACWRWCW